MLVILLVSLKVKRVASKAQIHMAMVQNQWYHLGIGAPPIVHWGYGVLTHGHTGHSSRLRERGRFLGGRRHLGAGGGAASDQGAHPVPKETKKQTKNQYQTGQVEHCCRGVPSNFLLMVSQSLDARSPGVFRFLLASLKQLGFLFLRPNQQKRPLISW